MEEELTLSPELSREFFVTPGLCNARRELPVSLLVSNIIEVATEHANNLGIGFRKMTPEGVGWVLSRLTVEMYRYPSFNERYTLTTWIETWNRHFSVRDFMVTAPDGSVSGYARTVWMVIDLSTHASVGTSALDFDTGLISSRPCPVGRQKRHARLPPQLSGSYIFRYTDIDFYGHVNTTRYVELLLNQFPLSRYEHSHVRRLEVAFQHEARFGERAVIDIAESGEGRYALTLRRDDDILLDARLTFS